MGLNQLCTFSAFPHCFTMFSICPSSISSKNNNAQVEENSGFGSLEVACWPLVPKFAGSNPTEAVGFFRVRKILNTPPFGREIKSFVPCRRFMACKRSLNVTCKSGIFRENSSTISRPSRSSFHYQGLWWRHLEVQVGTTKDQGLYNKSSAAVHPGALAAGTLLQYNRQKKYWRGICPSPHITTMAGTFIICHAHFLSHSFSFTVTVFFSFDCSCVCLSLSFHHCSILVYLPVTSNM